MFKHVLFVGPQYKDHRGGIGAVLATYAASIEGFQFIASFDGNRGKIGNVMVFLRCIIKLSWRLAFRKEIEIIHLHSASKGSFYRKYILFLLAKYLGRRKVIYHLHGGNFHNFYDSSSGRVKRAINHIFSKADSIVCLSNSWSKYLGETFNSPKLAVVNNPVSLGNSSDHQHEKTNSRLHLLFLGLINENKGIFDLLTAIVNEKNFFEGKIVLSIGGSGDVEKLEKFIKEKGIDSIVKFKGWVDGQEKEVILSACDVLILPSYYEGLPVCILEAMNHGKAIIATTVGGIPEIVTNNENGFLFTPGDTKTLTSLLKMLTTDPELVKRLGDASLEKVKPYLINNVIKQLEVIYKSIA